MQLKIFKPVILVILISNLLISCSSPQQQKEIAYSDVKNYFHTKASFNDVKNKGNINEDKSNSSFFSEIGYGEIHLGDKFNNRIFKQDSDTSEECFSAVYSKNSNISVMVENNIITGISTQDPKIYSKDNIKVGYLLKQVYDILRTSKYETLKNPYTSEPIIIHWNNNKKNIGTRYDFEHGKISAITLGYEDTLKNMEGCS